MVADNGTNGGLLTYGELVLRIISDVDAELERRRWNTTTRDIIHQLVLDALQENGDPFAEIGDPFGPPGDPDPQ